MGLDGVELILAVEERFGVAIDVEEAGSIRTVGDLFGVVRGKVKGVEGPSCMTSAAFYAVRRGLIAATGIERNQIRPATPLAALLPCRGRRRRWRRMQEAMSYRLPELRFHGVTLLLLGATACAVPIQTFRANGSTWTAAIVATLFLGPMLLALLVKFAPMAAVAFPENSQTAGDLARVLLASQFGELCRARGEWREQELWEALCATIVAQTGVARSKLVPEARIVDDLGID